MASMLVRPKPLRPAAPPHSAPSFNSGGHRLPSCPPLEQKNSSRSGSSTPSRNTRVTSSLSSTATHVSRRGSDASPSPPSPSHHSQSSGEALNDYSALEELLSILGASHKASPPPILLPPSPGASRGSGLVTRTGSHRRRSSSIVMMRAGSSDGQGLIYSPPSRALTRNPFLSQRHAATAASFHPSYTSGQTPFSAIVIPPHLLAMGAHTMPVTPLSITMSTDLSSTGGQMDLSGGSSTESDTTPVAVGQHKVEGDGGAGQSIKEDEKYDGPVEAMDVQ